MARPTWPTIVDDSGDGLTGTIFNLAFFTEIKDYIQKGLEFKNLTELTISAGVVTVTEVFHAIDTEGDAGSDDLDTINGGTTGALAVLRPASDARTVVVKHGTGNIWFKSKADLSLDDLQDALLLIYDGTKWMDLGTGIDLTTAVLKSLFNANTILAANTNDTPAALTIAEQRLVGRITAGNITGLTATQIRTLINVANGAIANLIEDTTPQLGGDLDAQTKRIYDIKLLDFKAPTELTISSGAITVTQSFHKVDTEGDASSDDLDTINGEVTGRIVVLRAENDARTIVIKHNTGNIWLKGKADLSLDDLEDGLALIYTGTKWIDLGAGGGAGASTFVALTDTPANYTGEAEKAVKVNAGETAVEFGPPLNVVLETDGTLKEHVVEVSAKARAYLSANQLNIVNNTWTKILLDGESYDPGTNFASYKFTAPVSGYYTIGASVVFDSVVADKRWWCGVYKNGARISELVTHSSHAAAIGSTYADVIYLAANDYVELYVCHDAGVDTPDVVGAERLTYMAIHFLSKA